MERGQVLDCWAWRTWRFFLDKGQPKLHADSEFPDESEKVGDPLALTCHANVPEHVHAQLPSLALYLCSSNTPGSAHPKYHRLTHPRSASGQYEGSDTTPEKQLECFFWRRDGFCKFSEEDCLYAHHPTGKIKEYNDFKDKGSSFRPYKSTPASPAKKTECFFWGQGICKFSADECMYAHYRVDDPEGSERRRRERRHDTPETFNHYDDSNILPSKQLECYFWRRDGYCKFSEEECLYAHHRTGKVKEIPGQAKIMDRETEPLGSSQHIDKTPTEYAMPQPPSIPLSELTLSAFFDLFCYTNPSARRDRPWETVLKMFKTYVLRNFGKDTGKHVLAAYTRVRCPDCQALLKPH